MTPADLQILIARGVKLVTAESCTGGLVAAALSDHPGSSTVLMGGLVTYSNDAKQALLGVRRQHQLGFGVVCPRRGGDVGLGLS